MANIRWIWCDMGGGVSNAKSGNSSKIRSRNSSSRKKIVNQ